MKIRFRTGEMAAHYGISKQTLIYYDKIGLFQPRETNEETGYRYYSIEQCESLDVILALKNLGMSLKDIQAYLQLETIDERIAVLEGQEAAIQDWLRMINRARNRIGSMIRAFRERKRIVPFDKGIVELPRREVISELVQEPNDLYEFEKAIKRLLAKTASRDDTGIHEFVVTVEVTESGDEYFQKVAQYVGTDASDFIPAGSYAYIYHKGTHHELLNTLDGFNKYIDSQGYERIGAYVSNMLLDSLAVAREDEYLLEIQAPVRRKGE